MLSATTKDGNIITLVTLSKQAIDELREKEKFYCPICQHKVIIKAGTMMIPHFAHYKTSQCDLKKRGEGEYHYKGKLLLYDWLVAQQIDVSLEAYIPCIQQRPDLLLRWRGRLIAIEYQCATIDRKIVYERNQGYKRANIIPIWILGANQLTRLTSHHIRINSFTLSFLHQFSPTYPTMLFYLCPYKKQLLFLHDLFIVTATKAFAQHTYLPLSSCSFLHFFQRTYIKKATVLRLWRQEKRHFRLQPSGRFRKERIRENWLYNQQIYRDQLPAHIFLPIRSQYKMNVPLWNWQSRFILGFFQYKPFGSMFTVNEAEHFLRKYIVHKIDKQLIRVNARPVLEYIRLLEASGIVESVADEQYKKIASSTKNAYIEQALNADDELLRYFMYNQMQMK